MALGLVVGGTTSAVVVNGVSADDSTGEIGLQKMHPQFMENVDRSLEEIDNGVVITLTTDDADTLEKLQQMEENLDESKRPDFMQEVERSVEILDNGVQITLTSEDAEIVEKLQNMPEPGEHFENLNIERSVENIDNGVIITLTSDDAEVVKMLQEKGENGLMPGHHRGKAFMNGSENETQK